MSLVETLLRVLFAWLIYPGLVFLIGAGWLVEGLRRQFAARAEGRDAPPFFQPVAEFRKLIGRPAFVPTPSLPREDDAEAVGLAELHQEGTRLGLYAVPVTGLLALASGLVLLPLPGNLWPFLDNNGMGRALGADLPGAALLLLWPVVGMVLLGSLAGSVYAQVAGSRIFQLLTVCGLPYAIAVFGPALAEGSLDLKTIIADSSLPMIGTKTLCGLLFLLCLPVLLRLRPLAASTGETLEGITTDLAGAPLALINLMGQAERLALSVLFAVLFVPFAADNPLFFLAGSLLALGVIGIVETLFGQVRLREALNFYLRYANPAALILLVLTAFGVKV